MGLRETGNSERKVERIEHIYEKWKQCVRTEEPGSTQRRMLTQYLFNILDGWSYHRSTKPQKSVETIDDNM